MEQIPSYDTYRQPRDGSNAKRLSVKTVNSIDDLMKVFAIRAATYMAEQNCPYEEEFDGNDFCAAHILGFIDDEPAGCVRVRFFADFAKVERFAIRSEFRNSRLAFKLIRAAIDFARKKGFRLIYGHPHGRLINFWKKLGAVMLEGGKEFVFSDFKYFEMTVELEPDPDAIGLGTNPYVILRPEGQWHRRGVLEDSSKRPADTSVDLMSA